MGLLDIDDHISESILLENGWECSLGLFRIPDMYLKTVFVKKNENIKLFCFVLTYLSESDKWLIKIGNETDLEVNTYADITIYIQHHIQSRLK